MFSTYLHWVVNHVAARLCVSEDVRIELLLSANTKHDTPLEAEGI
jgi:RNase P/RNase MRP subunit p30